MPGDGPAEDVAVYVAGLAGLAAHAARLRPAGLVSLVPRLEQPPTPAGLDPARHLQLEIDDIEAPIPGFVVPDEAHVARLLDFAGGWQAGGPLLIHCAAGISRSTAAALAVLALNSAESEATLARRLRRLAPHAAPNRRIVALADRLMARQGRLVAAVAAIGRPRPALEGPLVRLPLTSDAGGR